jgi:hypothetical protein
MFSTGLWIFADGRKKHSFEKTVCTRHDSIDRLSFIPDSLTMGSSRNSAGMASSAPAALEATDNVAAAA